MLLYKHGLLKNKNKACEIQYQYFGLEPSFNIHMSSSKKIEDEKVVQIAHADYIYESIQTFGQDFDCEIEAKAKDLAVLKYRQDFTH